MLGAVGLALVVLWSGSSEAARKHRAKAAPAAALTAETINSAAFERSKAAGKGISPVLIKTQVLLDRARFSPGTIDGRPGSNMDKALAAFAKAQHVEPGGKLDAQLWEKLAGTSSEPVVVDYTIAAEDVKGPFLDKIPREFEEMAELDRLGYTSPRELLSEKFHVTEGLLTALNPGKALDREGIVILVPNVARPKEQGEKGRVAKIEVDKAEKSLRAFDKEGQLVAVYPASIGSTEKPPPRAPTRSTPSP